MLGCCKLTVQLNLNLLICVLLFLLRSQCRLYTVRPLTGLDPSLFSLGSRLQGDKIATLVKAANITVESYWPGLFAKLLEKRSVEDLITNVGSGLPLFRPLFVFSILPL